MLVSCRESICVFEVVVTVERIALAPTWNFQSYVEKTRQNIEEQTYLTRNPVYSPETNIP